jgi:transcriptional regulator of acetoin/glycerol metabolism
VRELRNIVLQAAMLSDDGVITAHHLADIVTYREGSHARTHLSLAPTSDVDLLALLDEHGGNVSRAARAARLPRSTFRDRVRRARTRMEGAEPQAMAR